jgi:hypothetical protein
MKKKSFGMNFFFAASGNMSSRADLLRGQGPGPPKLQDFSPTKINK